MIFNNKDKNYYLKIKRNHFLKKSRGVYKFLYLDNEPINVLVTWLKTKKDVQEKLACWQGFNYDKCFLITNQYEFNTYNFLINVDIVNVDLNYKVKNIWTNVKPNTNLHFNESYGHIFIFKSNTIYSYGIEIDKTLFTASR